MCILRAGLAKKPQKTQIIRVSHLHLEKKFRKKIYVDNKKKGETKT